MKLIYFKWQPINTIVLIVTIILFIVWLISAMKGNPIHHIAGFLGILILFIARWIMWTGWDKQEIIRLNKEIEFLKTQK